MDVIKAFYACRFFHEKNNNSKTSKLPIFLFYLWHIVPFFLLLLPLDNETVGAVGKATAKKTSLLSLIIFVLFCSYLIITGINDLSLKPKKLPELLNITLSSVQSCLHTFHRVLDTKVVHTKAK